MPELFNMPSTLLGFGSRLAAERAVGLSRMKCESSTSYRTHRGFMLLAMMHPQLSRVVHLAIASTGNTKAQATRRQPAG